MVKIIIPENQRTLMSNDERYREAVELSVYMASKFYPENPEFHPCDSTRGVISQIDNMVTGLKRITSKQRLAMASTEKECAYVKCDNKFYGGKRAMYCCEKCGTYQRRLNQKESAKTKCED